LPRQSLLDFEDRIHAFGRDMYAGIVREDQRRIQVVIDRDIDLAAAASIGIHDERRRCTIALWEITVEQIDPTLLTRGSAGAGMLERFSDREAGEHLILHAEEDLTEVDSGAVDRAGHGSPHSM